MDNGVAYDSNTVPVVTSCFVLVRSIFPFCFMLHKHIYFYITHRCLDIFYHFVWCGYK